MSGYLKLGQQLLFVTGTMMMVYESSGRYAHCGKIDNIGS